jgi:hypothetical protein
MGQLEDNSLLAENVDLARTKPGVVCADGDKRLNRVVCYLGDLAVEAKCLDLKIV